MKRSPNNELSKIRMQKVLSMGVFLMLSFSILRFLPGLQITTEILIGVMVVALPILVFNKLINPRLYFTSVEKYALVILLAMPLIGATTALLVYGQPFEYGLISQRSILLVGCSLLISHWLHSGKIRVDEVAGAFKILAWLNLALCAPVVFLFNPNEFPAMPNFVSDGGGVYNQFILPLTFIIFGFFYYAVTGIRHRSKSLTMLSWPFLIYIVLGVGGRTLMISVTVTYVIFAVILTERKKIISSIIKIMIFMSIFALLIQILEPDKLEELFSKYADAFLALLHGEEGGDPSANARILQVAIALPLIYENPLLGTGTVSNQWAEGYKSIFGYFHPSDIGLIGVVFVFGVLGAIIFAYQIIIALKISKYLIRSEPSINDLYYVVAAYLVYFFLSSVVTGAYVFWVEHSLILMAILQFGKWETLKIRMQSKYSE